MYRPALSWLHAAGGAGFPRPFLSHGMEAVCEGPVICSSLREMRSRDSRVYTAALALLVVFRGSGSSGGCICPDPPAPHPSACQVSKLPGVTPVQTGGSSLLISAPSPFGHLRSAYCSDLAAF